MTTEHLRCCALALAVTLVGCARAPTATAPARSTQPNGWATSTWEERHDVMTWSVLPTMAHAFQHADQRDTPSLTCRTCHGDDAEAQAYALPNRRLMLLDPAALPTASSSQRAKFMHEIVVPRMRELTDDPTLGCFSCHPRAGAP